MAIQDYTSAYEVELNRDSNGNPRVIGIINETHIIYDSHIVLKQIPSDTAEYRVLITGKTEININEEITNITQFKVDYKHEGTVYFHPNLEGTSITINLYYGRGIKLLYDTRVKLTDENNYWTSTTLKKWIDEIAQNYKSIQYIDDLHTITCQNSTNIICEEGTTINVGEQKQGTVIYVI